MYLKSGLIRKVTFGWSGLIRGERVVLLLPYICGYETLFYLRARENLDVRKQEIKSIQNSEGTTLLMTILHLTVTVKTSMMNKTVTSK